MTDTISTTVTAQFQLMLASFLTGIFIFLLYDFFRSLRRVALLVRRQRRRRVSEKWQGPKIENWEEALYVPTLQRDWLVHLEDLLFWFIYIALTYRVIYTYNHGTFSLYVLLGELLGIGLYYAVFRNRIRCVITCFVWQIYALICWILHFLFLFIYFFEKMIRNALNFARKLIMIRMVQPVHREVRKGSINHADKTKRQNSK